MEVVMKIFIGANTTSVHADFSFISIGLVSEDGRAFYAEFNDYDDTYVNNWTKDNIINNLILQAPNVREQEHYIKSCVDNKVSLVDKFHIEMRGCRSTIRLELLSWLRQFNSTVEIWGDYLPYYWMLFCSLLDDFSLPEYVDHVPFDICTLFKFNCLDPNIDRESYGYNIDMNQSMKFIKPQRYNALWKAYVTRACFNKLKSTPRLRSIFA